MAVRRRRTKRRQAAWRRLRILRGLILLPWQLRRQLRQQPRRHRRQVSSEPRKIYTVTIRADQSGVADVSAEFTRAHMAAAPTALANANSAAAVAFSGSGGGYAVQVTSERSESKAQAAFRALQAKYPNQLSGR